MAKYKYLNTKNGAVFESNVLCGGGPWVPFDDAVKEQAPEQEPEQAPEQEPEQAPEQEPEQAPEQAPEQEPEQAPEETPKKKARK